MLDPKEGPLVEVRVTMSVEGWRWEGGVSGWGKGRMRDRPGLGGEDGIGPLYPNSLLGLPALYGAAWNLSVK